MTKANVSPEVRRLLDTAGEDYLRAVEYIAGMRESAVLELARGEMSTEHLHAVRGKIVALDDALAILGWSEVREHLKRYSGDRT